MKATQYRWYINEHQERYGEFYRIFATDEIAEEVLGVKRSGFTNEKVTEDTEDVIDKLRETDTSVLEEALATSAIIALAYQLGRVIRSGDISRGISRGISGGISEGWMAENKPLAKVVDFVPLGALSRPGAPDPDLCHSRIKVLR